MLQRGFLRASGQGHVYLYGFDYDISRFVEAPAAKAQVAHRHLILWMARRTPISEAEHQMNEWYAEAIGWSNPLLSRDEAERDRFYDSPAFRACIFGMADT